MSTCRSDRDPKCTVEKHRTRGTILGGAKFLAQQSVGGRGHLSPIKLDWKSKQLVGSAAHLSKKHVSRELASTQRSNNNIQKRQLWDPNTSIRLDPAGSRNC